MEITPKLLWYMRAIDTVYNRPGFEWTFLIINRKERIESIRTRLNEQLWPIIEINERDSGKIQNSRLFYELFSIVCNKSEIDFGNVYRGLIKKDERLRPGKTSKKLLNLCDKIAQGKI